MSLKLNSRVFWGVLALVIAVITIFFASIIRFNNQTSSILLTSEKNSFTLKPEIQKNDIENFHTFLNNLNVPLSAENGIQFQLDSTSSAKLDFATPIKANLKIEKDSISFSGSLDVVPLLSSAETQIKVPSTTNLAIYAPDMTGFLKDRLDLPSNLRSWLSQNVATSDGSFLVVWGSDANYAVFFKNKNINFDALKNLKNSAGDPAYKEDMEQNIKTHLLQLPKQDAFASQEQTISILDLEEWQVIASSPKAAQELIEAQDKDSRMFPINTDSYSLAIDYENPDQNSVSEKFEELILQSSQSPSLSKDSLWQSLTKIKQATFSLKGKDFSGLINIK